MRLASPQNWRMRKETACASLAAENEHTHAAAEFHHLLKASTLTCCSLTRPSCCDIACLRPDPDTLLQVELQVELQLLVLGVSADDSTIVIGVKSRNSVSKYLELSCSALVIGICSAHGKAALSRRPSRPGGWVARALLEVLQLLGCTRGRNAGLSRDFLNTNTLEVCFRLP